MQVICNLVWTNCTNGMLFTVCSHRPLHEILFLGLVCKDVLFLVCRYTIAGVLSQIGQKDWRKCGMPEKPAIFTRFSDGSFSCEAFQWIFHFFSGWPLSSNGSRRHWSRTKGSCPALSKLGSWRRSDFPESHAVKFFFAPIVSWLCNEKATMQDILPTAAKCNFFSLRHLNVSREKRVGSWCILRGRGEELVSKGDF